MSVSVYDGVKFHEATEDIWFNAETNTLAIGSTLESIFPGVRSFFYESGNKRQYLEQVPLHLCAKNHWIRIGNL